MSGLMKILVITAPVLALLLFYVITKQSQMDTEMKKEDARFEREWAEFNKDFSTSGDRQKYEQRAQQAEQEFQELKKKEKEKEEKTERIEKELEKAIEEHGKDAGKK